MSGANYVMQSFSSPGVLVGELSILGLWFACTFVY